MAQSPTHSKCPPWLPSAVPALSISWGSLTQAQGHPPPHGQHTKKLALGGGPLHAWPPPSPWHCWTPRSLRPPPEEAGSPTSWFHSFPHLSTPPRNTTSLHGPMLVHLRNKTQKQIKRQFLFQQEGSQTSGIPGKQPSVPTPGGYFPPSALVVLKAEASKWFAPAVILHLISFVFPPPMFALTQVPFIETLVIKCKTLLGTTGQGACNSYQSVCREVAGRAGRALSPPF